MTRKRSSPMGLEIYLPVLLAFVMLPLLAQAAPLQDYTEIQQYSEGCYYNYNHYNEGDRIMTNEPCLNCTCHNKMLMCYLRVCPFTKPIGHDCIVEKREDQCCPIITCPEVPVDVAHVAPAPGTELSFPEKFGCSIDGKFYLEGAQVPSNPNKPCELCYCIKNRTSCLMQECTLHIDGCTPIYNKGSCCPVRYNCDHENDVLELEDHSTTTETTTSTTTTERPTPGFIITSTMSPSVSTDCVHNGELYADGARIPGETACENCYCMRGDIICAVQECHMPELNGHGKTCHALPAAEGECCPSNYVCEDDSATTQIIEATTAPYAGLDEEITTSAPVKDLHSGIPEEDLQLQAHIDDEETATSGPVIETKKEEQDTEAVILGKPTEQPTAQEENKQEGAKDEEESVSKTSEDAEATTVSYADVKPIESDEFVTKAPTSADMLPTGAPEEDKLETSEEVTTTPAEDEGHVEEAKPSGEETVTKLPISADELSEASTDSAASGEYASETSDEVKPESEESVTKVPAADAVETDTATEFTATGQEVSEESTESAEEVKPVDEEEFVTKTPVPEEGVSTETLETEHKPVETEESATVVGDMEVTEEEHKPTESDESVTKTPVDTEHITDTAEEGQHEESETKIPLTIGQHDELATEAPAHISEEQSTETSEEETDELSTKAPTADEEQLSSDAKPEQEIAATTEAPVKVVSEGEDLSTEGPKEEDRPEISESVTEIPAEVEKQDEVHKHTETSAEEGEMVTKLPVSADEEHQYGTTVATVEEEKEHVPTKAPLDIDSVFSEEETEASTEISEEEASGEGKPVSADEQIGVTHADIESEEHTTPSAEHKPVQADELGSGDFATELAPEKPSEESYVSPALEVVTSVPQSEEQEYEHGTVQTVMPTEGQPVEQLSEESDEDSKLMDLTTAKPSAVEESKEEEQLEVTTSKPSIFDVTTSADELSAETSDEQKEAATKLPTEQESDELELSTSTPIKATAEDKTKEQSAGEDTIDITTMATSHEEKLPTEEHKDEVFGEAEITTQASISSSTSAVIESEEEEASGEEEGTEESVEAEDITTHKTVQKDEETGDHKVEEPIGITDSPMVIVEDMSALTTVAPTADEDISTESESEADGQKDIPSTTQEPSLDVKIDTTSKPFVQPTHVDEMPDMQLPSVIPGEGDCLVGQKTYENNTIVPTSDECEIVCKCVSSIVTCERVKCDVPENVENCILDEASTNKCCPTYVCGIDNLPSKAEESAESPEEDEETKYTTVAPHKLPTDEHKEEADIDKSEITTTKPVVVSEVVTPGDSIPEIEMPVASTEEPMSHVKHEDEYEQDSTKSPVETVAEDKKDVVAQDEVSTTPAAVIEDIVVPQSMAPVETSEQEKPEFVTEKAPIDTVQKETASEAELPVDQEQPEKELDEQTTVSHGHVETVTDSGVHVFTDEKEESATPALPSSDEYQTVKPFEKEDSDEHKETDSFPTSSEEESAKPEEISEHDAHTTVSPVSTSEEDKEIEAHTSVPSVSSEEDKESSEEHTVIPTELYGDKKPSQEPETHTDHPVAADEGTTLTTSEEEVNVGTTAPIDKEQEQISEDVEVTTAKISEIPTASTESDEKETESDEKESESEEKEPESQEIEQEDVTRTTAVPEVVEEHVSTTAKLPTDETKDETGPSEDHTFVPALDEIESTSKPVSTTSEEDHTLGGKPLDELPVTSISEEEDHTAGTSSEETEDISATTVSSLLGQDKEEIHPVAPATEKDKDQVKPTDEEQDIDRTTTVPESVEEASIDSVASSEEEVLEHTMAPVAYDEHKETVGEFDITPEGAVSVSEEDKQTESQTVIAPVVDHSVVPSFEESDDEETPATESATDKPIDFETKIDTTSSVPSIDEHTDVSGHDVVETTPTTAASTDEDKEYAEDHTFTPSTGVPEKQPTESAEEPQSEEVPEKVTESIEEHITVPSIEGVKGELEPSMAHTVAPSKEEEHGTKAPAASDEYVPEEGVEHITSGPFTSDETTAEVISSEEDTSAPTKEEASVSETDTTSTPAVDVEQQSTHAPVHPSLDLSLEASGESIESEEEISTEPTKIQHIGEFVTERVEEVTSKPTVQSEEDKEASGEEGEEIEEMEHATDKPHVPAVEQEVDMFATTEHVAISEKPEGVEESTDKLSETDVSADGEISTTKAPISSEDSFEHQTEAAIPSVTKAPLAEEHEGIIAQQPEEQDISSVTETPVSADEIEHVTAQQPETEEQISEENVATEEPKKDVFETTEGITSVQSEVEGTEHTTTYEDVKQTEIEEEITKTPLPDEDIAIQQGELDATKAPLSIGGIETVTDKQLEDEHVSDVTKSPIEEIEHITSHQTEEESSSTKAPLVADEIEHVPVQHPADIEDIDTVTIRQPGDEEEVSVVTESVVTEDIDAVTSQVSDEVESEEEEDIESATAKLPTQQGEEVTEPHILTEEQSTEQGASEQDIESVDMATNKPSEEGEKDETTTTKLPVHADEVAVTTLPTLEVEKESEDMDKIEKETTEVPKLPEHEFVYEVSTSKLPEMAEHVTELPGRDTEFEEGSTEVPSDKLPELTTDLPVKGTESEEATESSVAADKLPEHTAGLPAKDTKSEVQESTGLPSVGHVEHITELPAKETETEQEVSHEVATELPVDAHDKLDEHITEVPTKESETEQEESHEVSTDLPAGAVSFDEHPELVTKLPTKDTESEELSAEQHTELPMGAEVSTDKLQEHTTELPTKDVESTEEEQSHVDITEVSDHKLPQEPTKDVESEEEDESQEQATELPVDAHISTDKLDEHITEVPTKETETEQEVSHEIATEVPAGTLAQFDELPEHVTELPTKGIESEEVSQDQSTELPVDSEVPSAELPEHVTELPTKEVESAEEQQSHEDVTEVSGDKLPEEHTEVGESQEDIESQEQVTDMHVSIDKSPEQSTELPTKYTESEEEESHEEATELPEGPEVATDKLSEHVTEVPSKDIELDEQSTKLPVAADELPEHITESEVESHEESTKLPTGSEKLPEVSEHVTELPSKDVESEEEFHEKATELPAVVPVSEQSTELPSKTAESEDESHEEATESPVIVPVSTDILSEVAEHVTELPSKSVEEESNEETTVPASEVSEHVSTDKLHEVDEHVTELSTKDDEVTEQTTEIPSKDVELEVESHEEATEMPVVVPVSTDKIPEVAEHVTGLPSKDVGSEEEATELPPAAPVSEVAMHVTELPSKDVESEEATELPAAAPDSEVAEQVTKLPSKDVESEEESHEEATESPMVAQEVSTIGHGVEQSTQGVPKEEETVTEKSEDVDSSVKLQPPTTVHPLFAHHTTFPAVPIDSRFDEFGHTTPAPARDEVYTTHAPTTTTLGTTSTSAPHYQPQPPIYGQPPQYGPTQYEDEYTDEEEGEVFGPGTCRYGGKLYVSAQQIPRDDPCDFCFCFRSDIICLQQSCPPPIAGCHEEPISGFCCPRYECPVSMATVLNITTSTTTTSTTLPPHFLHHSYGNNVQRNGCLINGRSYRVGEKIESTSGPCINCTCGGDGKMKCDPQACVPEPTMQQVMAVVAAGRKR